MTTYTCTQCQVTKPEGDYQPAMLKRKGKWCRDCCNKRHAAWHQANAKTINAKHRERYHTKTKEQVITNQRRYILKKHFNLTPEEYASMLEEQGGICRICGNPPTDKKALCVDHNHDTGAVRGLLCSTCNTGLGQFQDSPDMLQKAREYLLSY